MKKVIFKVFSVVIVLLFCIHTAAVFAIPERPGFDPHPWCLAMPEFLNTIYNALYLPCASLEVLLSYPVTISAFFCWLAVYLFLLFRAKKHKKERSVANIETNN